MAKNLKLFETVSEYNSYMDGTPVFPNVSFIKEGEVRFALLPENSIKISYISSDGSGEGVVLALNSYNTSDLTNNPPKVFGPDGVQLTGVNWKGSDNFILGGGATYYRFNNDTAPTTYTITTEK